MIHSELGVLLKLMQNLDYYLGFLLPCSTLAMFVIVCIIIVRKLWVWRGNKQPLHEKKMTTSNIQLLKFQSKSRSPNASTPLLSLCNFLFVFFVVFGFLEHKNSCKMKILLSTEG